MAKIYSVQDKLWSACRIAEAFSKAGRDFYPTEVYEWIKDFIDGTVGEDEIYELDPIAWASDICQDELHGREEVRRERIEEIVRDYTIICERRTKSRGGDRHTIYYI